MFPSDVHIIVFLSKKGIYMHLNAPPKVFIAVSDDLLSFYHLLYQNYICTKHLVMPELDKAIAS